MFDHPHGKEIFPNAQSELLCSSFVLFLGVLPSASRSRAQHLPQLHLDRLLQRAVRSPSWPVFLCTGETSGPITSFELWGYAICNTPKMQFIAYKTACICLLVTGQISLVKTAKAEHFVTYKFDHSKGKLVRWQYRWNTEDMSVTAEGDVLVKLCCCETLIWNAGSIVPLRMIHLPLDGRTWLNSKKPIKR